MAGTGPGDGFYRLAASAALCCTCQRSPTLAEPDGDPEESLIFANVGLATRLPFSSGIMATSPTVLAGASAAPPESSPASVAAPVEAKFPLLPLLIAVVVGVLVAGLGVGGVGYYLVRTGRLPGREGSARKAESGAPATTHPMVLEPLLVNLADAGGSSYLRVAMTLRVADAVEGKDAKAKEEKPKEDKEASDATASVRDTMLTVLGRQNRRLPAGCRWQGAIEGRVESRVSRT